MVGGAGVGDRNRHGNCCARESKRAERVLHLRPPRRIPGSAQRALPCPCQERPCSLLNITRPMRSRHSIRVAGA
jgi:hypothetical protein